MNILKSLFFSFVLIADDRISFVEKCASYLKLLIAFGPIAYCLDLIGFWFIDNKKFVTFFIGIVILNAFLGIIKHRKLNTFNWETFFVKKGKMLLVVIATYFLLSLSVGITDDDYIAVGFEKTIQVMTLFYPASKGLKSIFIISNGEYPPKWIMKKVYNFEENGDLSELFKIKEDENNEG